jgi:hypothetical protein
MTRHATWDDLKKEPGFGFLADAARACVRGVQLVNWDEVGIPLIHESPATLRDFARSADIPFTHFPNGVSMTTPPLAGLVEMFGGFDDRRAHCVLVYRDRAVLVGIRPDQDGEAEDLGPQLLGGPQS